MDECLDKFCTKHKLDKEVAKEHALVKEVEKYYEKEGQNRPEIHSAESAPIGGRCK